MNDGISVEKKKSNICCSSFSLSSFCFATIKSFCGGNLLKAMLNRIVYGA
jgi:hypothetical protein